MEDTTKENLLICMRHQVLPEVWQKRRCGDMDV